MAKRKEHITINGEYFTIENKTVGMFEYLTFKTLYKCYDNPSFAKINIYDYWYEWFNNVGATYNKHGIIGYNCMQFSYGGYITINDTLYFAHITKAYNRLYKVV